MLVGNEREPHDARLPSAGAVSRTLLIAVVLAALLASSASGAPQQVVSSTTTELMPGVTYTREVDLTAAGPVVLDIVTAPKPDGTVYSLAPVLSNGTLGGTAKLTRWRRASTPHATTVGVDGDFFNAGGEPSSILMQGGVLENQPSIGRTSLGIAADGTLQAAEVSFYGTWQASAGQRKVTLNSRNGHFTLFTPAYGRFDPAGDRTSSPKRSSPRSRRRTRAADITGTVAQITSAGGTPIPPGGAVLVARGTEYAAQLGNEAPVGQPVTVHLTLTPDWSGLASAIGGGPLLVRNGKAVFANGETFRPGFLQSRSARGAVGQLADGRIVLVTVEDDDAGVQRRALELRTRARAREARRRHRGRARLRPAGGDGVRRFAPHATDDGHGAEASPTRSSSRTPASTRRRSRRCSRRTGTESPTPRRSRTGSCGRRP